MDATIPSTHHDENILCWIQAKKKKKKQSFKELHPWEWLEIRKDPFRNHPISGLHSSPTGLEQSVLTISKLQQLRQFGSSTILQMIGVSESSPGEEASYVFPISSCLCFLNRLKALLFQYGCNLHASSFKQSLNFDMIVLLECKCSWEFYGFMAH